MTAESVVTNSAWPLQDPCTSPAFHSADTPAFLNVCEFFQNLTGIYINIALARVR